MKIKTQILNIILLFTGLISAQQAPYLSAPRNNERYVRTEKLVLTWFEIDDAEGYQVQIASSDNFQVEDIVFSGKSNSEKITVSGLTQNTTYWWRVKVDSPDSPWSDIWKFATTVDPKPVTLYNPSNGTNNLETDVVVFNWSSDSANASFNFQISSEPDFSDTLRNITTDYNFIELTNLGSGQHYYWRVKPYNSDVLPGQWSDVFSFRTQLKKATLITPTNYITNQDTAITFRWSNVDLASIYDFQLGLDEDFQTVPPVVDTSTAFDRIKINGMLSDTVYFWRVKSRNSFNDTSKWTEPSTFRTKLAKPLLIFPVNGVRNLDITNINLQWSPGELFDTYRVQVALDTLFKNKISDSYLENNSAVVPRIENNTYYYWRVNRRTDNGDTSYWSDYAGFKTKLNSPESILPENNATQFSRNIVFTWQPVDSAEAYEFSISKDSLFVEQTIFETFEDTSAVIEELEINSNYFWHIRGINTFGDTSNWSEAARFSTSRFLVQPQIIDTLINFSKTPVDTIASINIMNGSNDESAFSNIIVMPDTIFSADKSEITIAPLSSEQLVLTADKSKIDTGFTGGSIKMVPQSDSDEDTLKIDFELYARMAILGFTDDTLFIDTTNSSNPVTKSFRLNNRKGNTTLDIERIYFEGSEVESFELIDIPDKVASGDSVTFRLKFSPFELDSNKAFLVIESNSFPDAITKIPIVGLGKGGQFGMRSLQTFAGLGDIPFEGLVNSSRSVNILNTGNLPIEYKVSFSNDYFELMNTSANSFRLQPGDSSLLDLHYITPDFNTDNVDTLVITHNAVGDSPLKFILHASFDSSSVASEIINSFRISGKQLPEISSGIIIGENTSIRAGFDNSLFEDENNLDFRMNYFTGGPGNKKKAVSANADEFIIPYQNTDESGLIILGELYTRGSGNTEIDSISIFGPLDVQVVLENYKSASITVPKSTPAGTAEEASVNWVFFGFPFDGVSADSVFNDLGQTVKMEDGQWIVYEFDPTIEDAFTTLNNSTINPGKGYFIAQSIMESFDLSYTYSNSITTRKLTDNTIELESGIWKTIANPYTFDVEIDTPAVAYRYDTGTKSYKLTSIMRPGEGYFIPPEVTELKLKNYGEYYPVLFPKVIAGSDWSLKINAASQNKTEELFAIKNMSKGLRKGSTDNLIYRKAPPVDNSFEAGFVDEDGNKYSTAVIGKSYNNTYKLYIESDENSSVQINLVESGKLPAGLSYKLFDYETGDITSGSLITVYGKNAKHLLLATGTDSFIENEIVKFESETVTEFKLFQNYPNPFNPTTTINYSIPVVDAKSASTTNVSLKVYDILGRVVAVLMNERKEPGTYSIEFNAGTLPSGVYFYRIKSGNYSETKKLVILK